jgi:hypothetical protein
MPRKKTLRGLPDGAEVRDQSGDIGTIRAGHIHYPETKPLTLGYADRYGPFTVTRYPAPPLSPAARRAAALLAYGGLT